MSCEQTTKKGTPCKNEAVMGGLCQYHLNTAELTGKGELLVVTGKLLRLPMAAEKIDSYGRFSRDLKVKPTYQVPIECELVGRSKKSNRFKVKFFDQNEKLHTELVKERYYLPNPQI